MTYYSFNHRNGYTGCIFSPFCLRTAVFLCRDWPVDMKVLSDMETKYGPCLFSQNFRAFNFLFVNKAKVK